MVDLVRRNTRQPTLRLERHSRATGARTPVTKRERPVTRSREWISWSSRGKGWGRTFGAVGQRWVGSLGLSIWFILLLLAPNFRTTRRIYADVVALPQAQPKSNQEDSLPTVWRGNKWVKTQPRNRKGGEDPEPSHFHYIPEFSHCSNGY